MNKRVEAFNMLQDDPIGALRKYDASGFSWEREFLDVPSHMQVGFATYYLVGLPPGNFLQAVLDNDFLGIMSQADHINRTHLEEWARLMYNIPRVARDREAWVECEGMIGWEEKHGNA